MVKHEKAYTMAYPDPGPVVTRREYGTGSVFQRCEARYDCPPLVNGDRPEHACKGRWFGVIDAGYTASGTRRRVTVSAKTRAEAIRKHRDKRLAMERDGRANTKRTVRVAAWAPKWLASIQPKITPSAYETDRAAISWIVRAIGDVKIADLTPDDVRAVSRLIRTEGGSSSSALRYHGSLSRMLKAASLEGYNLAPNVLLAEAPKAAISDRTALTRDHLAQLVPHLATIPDRSRWIVALLQGLRQAECLGLTWDAVNLEAGTMTVSWQAKSLRYLEAGNPEAGFRVPDGYEAVRLVGSTHLVRPKSKAGWRVIPLVPWAGTALREWAEIAPANPHQLVWPGRINRSGAWPRNPATDRDDWEAVQAGAKIAHKAGRPYHVHELRHTTATLLMELQVPESVRIAIMGHSSISTTQGYEHADLAQAKVWMERLGEKVGMKALD